MRVWQRLFKLGFDLVQLMLADGVTVPDYGREFFILKQAGNIMGQGNLEIIPGIEINLDRNPPLDVPCFLG